MYLRSNGSEHTPLHQSLHAQPNGRSNGRTTLARTVASIKAKLGLGADALVPLNAEDVGATGLLNLVAKDPIRVIAAGIGAYHGYKRTRTPIWAAVYAGAAAFSPILTGVWIYVQGFAKPKGWHLQQ